MQSEKKHKNIFNSAIMISCGVFLSRLTGLVRDILFAKYLGSGIIAESFYVAFRLPNTFRRIFAEGAFSNAFVPFFASRVNEDKKSANYFAGRIFVILSLALILLTVIMEVFMPQIIRVINPGFLNDKEKFNFAVQFSRIAFPYIILISICSFFGSILNSIGSFWQFASISVVLNLVFIIGLIVVSFFNTNIGFALSWLLIVAGVVQVIILAYYCIKKSVFPILIRHKVINRTKEELQQQKIEEKIEIKQFLKKLLPAIFSSGILQINIFVDGIFASFFTGAVSYLYYTDRIGQFPLSIIGYSLSVAILPSLSIAFKNKNTFEIANTQKQSFNIAMFFSIPAMFLFATIATHLVSLIYERGAFTPQDTKIVSNMLMIYAVSIPFNVMLKIFFSCFYAQKDTKTPLKISSFALIFNIIANLFLFKIVGMYCVVIATTLSAVISCILSVILLKKQKQFFIQIKDLTFFGKITLLSFISCVICPILLSRTDLFWILYLSGMAHIILLIVFKIITKQLMLNFIEKYVIYKIRKEDEERARRRNRNI